MQYRKAQKKNSSKHRTGHEIIYGPNAIIECLIAGRRRILTVYMAQKNLKAWSRVRAHLGRIKPHVQYVSKDTLAGIARTPEHGGIVAAVAPFPYALKMFTPEKHPFVLFLDGIQDVGNLGAILRSAYCVGVDGVVLPKKGSAPLSSAVFKASAGYAEHLSIYRASSSAEAAGELVRAGYFLYLAVAGGGKDAIEVTYTTPLCLVIGNEAVGISKPVLEKGERITLPQRRENISYNASVASALLLFIVSHRTVLASFSAEQK